MFVFGVSAFLSAFLLFQIQPMIGKVILPWFGGAPAVWSAAMLFFQVLLTGGYAYAYWLMRRKRQAVVHVFLLALALIVLAALSLVWKSPITPDASWKPSNIALPLLDIFKLLAVSVGLPYFLLASNSPLMQAWFSRAFPERSYAKLYSLSNAGSLLGLLAYPVLIEPNLPLQSQGWMWSTGFAFFAFLACWIAVRNGRSPLLSTPEPDTVSPSPRPSLALMSLWVALGATASLFLLSVTNQISQEVAVIPFLWILPLALYLLSFILTFSGEGGYNRKTCSLLFVVAVFLTLFVLLNSTRLHVYWQILSYCLLLFSACMLSHGELYLLRPVANHLTAFYLMISIGGALGGMFVSLIAPVIFNGYWEFFVGLAMTIAIVLSLRGEIAASKQSRGMEGGASVAPLLRNNVSHRARFIFFVFGLVTLMLVLVGAYFSGSLYAKRNFYGVIRIREDLTGKPPRPAYLMAHGITVHGLQFIGANRALPTTYYGRDAGAGLAILNHPRYGHGLKVGMLGVGTGTLAVYGQPGDVYRMYEINPVVVDLAEGRGGYFSFIQDSRADVTMVLGDARLSLERELAETGSQHFDVLVLDTFSSDSIPVHLVTKEAFALYLDHLAPGGVIAAHITNLHLDLQPVFWQLARHYGLHMARIEYGGDNDGGYASHWVLLTRDTALLRTPAIQQRTVDLSGYSTSIKLWTDDYSNLFQILK
ncbi:MAG: fused MFS/spermidine synthase [Chloroflexi bacterium]|nr:fused MFS/spermidine synthase [Chloroflexota bacterium]